MQRHLDLVEIRTGGRQLARSVDDRSLAIRCADDSLEHAEQAGRARGLDKAARDVESPGAVVVVSPDHQQLHGNGAALARGFDGSRVEVRVLDDAARRLPQRICRNDQPAGRRQRQIVNVRAVDQEARRVGRELPRDRELEPRHARVVGVVVVRGEHRAQRLALVHRDHCERPVRAGERVERHPSAA